MIESNLYSYTFDRASIDLLHRNRKSISAKICGEIIKRDRNTHLGN
jgi:hypothetical protein